jgi:hypothetical protein
MTTRAEVSFVIALALAFPLQGAQAKWERVGGSRADTVMALAVSGATVFAATDSGVLRSADAGRHWDAGAGLPEGGFFSCLAVSGAGVLAGTIGSGVFISKDGGASWAAANSGLTDKRVMSLAASGEKLFAATMGAGVFVSADGGANWARAASGLPKDTSINVVFAGGSDLYAGTDYRGLYVSGDDGGRWTEILSKIDKQNPVSCLIACGGKFYAGTVNGVFCSEDGGRSWINPCSPVESMLFGVLPQTSVMCLAARGTELLAGTDGAGIFVSADNGKKWTALEPALKQGQVCALAVCGDHLLAGTMQGGLWRLSLSSEEPEGAAPKSAETIRLEKAVQDKPEDAKAAYAKARKLDPELFKK